MAMNRFGDCDDPLLKESFIIFLLKDNQPINALFLIAKWRSSSFYSWAAYERCELLLTKINNDSGISVLYEK